MPGMDGFEVTRRIRQDNTHRLLPIIMVTVLRETEDQVKGIEAGCDDFISKPIDKTELLARVRSLLKVKAYNDLLSNYRNELESEVIKRTEELKRALENLQQDITERKWAEKNLRESNERYRALFDHSLDLVYITDFDGHFIDANDTALNRLGYTREDIHSLNFTSLLSEDQLPLAFKTLQEIRETGIHESLMELRLRHKNGSAVHVETRGSAIMSNGTPVAMQAVARDVTDRKQAEALKENESKYRLLADNVHDVIFVLDMNLKYTYVSPSVKILRGYEPEEVLKQQSIEQTLTPSSMDLAMKTLSDVMEQEKIKHAEITESRTIQLEMRRKDGSTLWTEVKFSFIRDTDQRPVALWA